MDDKVKAFLSCYIFEKRDSYCYDDNGNIIEKEMWVVWRDYNCVQHMHIGDFHTKADATQAALDHIKKTEGVG